MGSDEIVDCIALFARGGDPAAGVVADIIGHCACGGLMGCNGDEFRCGVQSVFSYTGSLDSQGERYVQEASVRLLLTSGGVTNTSIRDALVDLLGKPIADSSALCIPTAEWGHPMCTPASAWRFIAGQSPSPMCDLGWKSVGVLELTALPSIGEERWVPWVREADVLLADGGDAAYLCHWMRQSGLADLLPSLQDIVWVGVSAGSMVMTPRIGDDFVNWTPPAGGDSTLGVVDFSIFPHLGDMPGNTMAAAERWAAAIAGPAYAMDDQTAIKVSDGTVEVISEGHWKLFPA